MKAYLVTVGDEYCFLIHGETRSKAKYRAYRCDPAGPHNHGEWETLMFDFKLKRLPLLDNKPITYENAKVAGFEYESEETDEHGDRLMAPAEEFPGSDCDCRVCKGKNNDQI